MFQSRCDWKAQYLSTAWLATSTPEEVALPMPYELWSQSCSNVMPRSQQLQRLFLVRHGLACGFAFKGKVQGSEEYPGLSYGYYSLPQPEREEEEEEEEVKRTI